MKFKVMKLAMLAIVLASSISLAQTQEYRFLSSEEISEKYPELKSAEKKVKSIVNEWRHELDSMQQQIENLEIEISKNRLIWTDTELSKKNSELKELKKARQDYAKVKFEPDGEYDNLVREVMKPIENLIIEKED